MTSPITITAAGALIVVGIATVTDIRTGKIFNWLTLPAVVVGIIVRAGQFALQAPDSPLPAAISGVLDGLFGMLVGLFCLGIFKVTIMKKLGGGDVKLMAALGAFLGPAMVLAVFIYHCFALGIYSVGVMALAFPWRQACLAYAAKDRSLVSLDRFNQVRKAPLPVAPFIAAGVLAAILFTAQTHALFGL